MKFPLRYTKEECLPYIDALLAKMPEYDNFLMKTIIDTAEIKKEIKPTLWLSSDEVQSLLWQFGYIVVNLTMPKPISLTEKGRDAKKAGGHTWYLANIKAKEQAKAEVESLTVQKLRGDVEKLQNELLDYAATKTRSKTSLAVSLISAAATTVTLLLKCSGKLPN